MSFDKLLYIMKIEPFDENLKHREIVSFDPIYLEIFSSVKAFVESALNRLKLFHIGSTAVPDLRGKSMVDIAAVTTEPNLRVEQTNIEKLGFHRREIWVDEDEKPYLCGSVKRSERIYNINIHICHEGDSVHKNSLAFIEKLKADDRLRREYERVKDYAHMKDPANPEVYNDYKSEFIGNVYNQFTKSV